MSFFPKCGRENNPEVEFRKFCETRILTAGQNQSRRSTDVSRAARPKHSPLPPVGIAIVATVDSILGALYAGVSITKITVGGWLIVLQFVTGIIALSAGWGLWDLKKWAPSLAIAFSVVDILVHIRYYLIHAVFPPTMIATFTFDMIVPAYLVMPKTRAYFSKGVQQR